MSYRSFQGKEIDMDKLMRQNELTQAVSNKKVNARGDELGEGGRIIKRREEIVADYYEQNPKATPKARPAPGASVQTEVEAPAPIAPAKTKKPQVEE
jgi:hypothetical protein